MDPTDYSHDMGEREPLDIPNPSPPRHRQQYPQQQQPYQQPYDQPPEQYPTLPQHPEDPFATPPRSRPGPSAHPDSAFDRLRAQRRYSREPPASGASSSGWAAGPQAAASVAPNGFREEDLASPVSPSQPPPHRGVEGRNRSRDADYYPPRTNYPPRTEYPPRNRAFPPQSNITPGADNFSDAAAGGMAGIALSVAEHNARESGLNAIQSAGYPQSGQPQEQWRNNGREYSDGRGGQMGGQQQRQAASGVPYGHLDNPADADSVSSLPSSSNNLSAGNVTPGHRTPSRSPHSVVNDIYTDDPYQIYSRPQDPRLGAVDPLAIEDDGDDGLTYGVRKGPRTSMLSLGGSSHRGRDAAAAAGGAAAGAAAGGVLGGLAGRNGTRNLSGYYAPVHNGLSAGPSGLPGEKSGWPSAEDAKKKSRRWRLIIILGVIVLAIAGIALGVVFGVVLKRNGGGGSSSSNGSSGSAADDTAANGDLGVNSGEIKALLNNPNLHKVFPGVDYTPVNTQYPDCIHNPPSQNNITRDVAVLSQLTNTIRLYGTDCNQTQMVIHALNQLKMQDTIKVWLGVWQDNNDTTNARQLTQMWDILDQYGEKPFKGLIVANEILFREQMTVENLTLLLSNVRQNVTARGMSLPVATSDLGDKWTAQLAAQSDYVMANIHPFFSGTKVAEAAAWTNNFWQVNNGPFFKSDKDKNIISETGWPSQGGTSCGTVTETVCPDKAVAGIDEMNQFMDDWVCQALANGTQYFWFEAFDEPWKIQFNTADQQWEDHWGLMDVDRNLKSGVKVPDCGGKTVD
ncbi:glycoside hydrolase superfamily [Lasiosphaeria miniovina]|uniref:glucan endo-1,3-beta-D-glucosidase n=1 Tax=Lasiosphaeria miniovina TaxID=1954250 RepID=A0AA40AJD7_9PEZI|nr:glycoside hydrolase superfamily [Lasiosphaeria miniovina]KAK0716894.1 glycoside hydrolase superfamily [Lasiosphaeria miniovina]